MPASSTNETIPANLGAAIFTAFIALICFTLGIVQLGHSRDLDASKTVTEAVIQSIKGANRNSSLSHVGYAFEAAGQTFQSDTVVPTTWLADRTVGSKITVRYVASNPKVSRVDAGEHVEYFDAYLVFGILSTGICIYALSRVAALRRIGA